jgi:hypothetical protein
MFAREEPRRVVDVAATMEKSFVQRVHAPNLLAWVGFRMNRAPLAFILAAIPLALVVGAVAAGPHELAKAILTQRNVQETFARFISAVATASAIAVSIASLTLGRELKGVGTLRDRHDENEEFRQRMREASHRDHTPLSVGGFLRVTAEAIAADARLALESASSVDLAMQEERVSLRELLESIERRATEAAARFDAVRTRPDKLLEAALDFEADVTCHMTRRFRRNASTAPLREALEGLEDRLMDYVIASRYTKTMVTSWGLSNMSWAIMVSTIPSILTAAFMVLAYGDGAQAALGSVGAGALVGLALSLVMLPLCFFVSYVLRFVFLNEHTLPTDGFVLGPEAWDMVAGKAGRPSARRPTRTG